MDFKIITLPKYEAEVCLHRSINDAGQQTVILTSFIFEEAEEDSEIILESELIFHSGEMSQNFIDDYSEKSAVDWLVSVAEKQGINLQ